MSNHSDSQSLLAWLDHLTVAQNATHTVAAYHRDVGDFMQYCQQHHMVLDDIQKSDLRQYISYCIERKNWSNATIQRSLSAIRQFMQWRSQRQPLTDTDGADALADFSIKRIPRPLPGMLSIETVNQLIDQPEPEQPTEQWLWKRDKAILELLYSSGLRLNELTQLSLNDIDRTRQLLRVTGKGNKTRVIPIGQSAINALHQWLKVRQSNLLHNKIFTSRHGNPISDRQVQNRIKLQAKRAGISADVHPHLLRHCFASHLLSNSGELRAVQEMLGHASLATTQVYTHLDFDRLAQVYDQAHPRAKK